MYAPDYFLFFSHPICCLRPSFSLSLLVVTQIWSTPVILYKRSVLTLFRTSPDQIDHDLHHLPVCPILPL